MSSVSYNYQSANTPSCTVLASQYNSLKKLTNGTHNLGEIMLKNGEFVAVNNHAHLTILNGAVTTKQENLNVRAAVCELLESHFVGLTAWGDSVSPVLRKVRERLLGTENKMMPITRKEVRTMIETLTKAQELRTEIEEKKDHKITQAEFDKQIQTEADMAERALGTSLYSQDNSSNVAAYRNHSAACANLARTLGSVKTTLNENQANALADLAVSRSRLYQEDNVFNMLTSEFQKRFGDGDMATKVFRDLRQKLENDLAKFSTDKLETLRQFLSRKDGHNYSQNSIRNWLHDGVADYINKMEAEFKSMQGVKIEDGRVVEMEALLDRKSSTLKHAMLHLLVEDSNMLEEYSEQLSFDSEAVQMKERQQQAELLNAALKEAGSTLKERHPTIAQNLDSWTDNMQNLQFEEALQKVDDINTLLREAGVKAGRNIAEINLDMLMQLRQPEYLLDCKQKYVKAFNELSAMGISPEMIGKHLSKDLLLAADYNTTVRHALGRIRSERFEKVDDNIRNALSKVTKELAEIREMKKNCKDFLKQIRSLMKEQITNMDDIEKADNIFDEKCGPLLKALDLTHNDTSVRMRLSLLLPDFINDLEQRETEANGQIDRLSGILEKSAETEARTIPPIDVGARLVAELRAFDQAR